MTALPVAVWRPTGLGLSAAAAPPGGSAPARLEVLCDDDLALSVSGDVVAATSAGVALLVTSQAPSGAYLNYAWTGGGGGDAMPAAARAWTLGATPGELRLSCSTLDRQGAAVVVDVVDPDGYWPGRSLADLGCALGAVPSWAVEGGTGTTAQEAVDDLIANVADAGGSPALSRSERAEVGYPDAPSLTWILGTADATSMTAVVTGSGSDYSAFPDVLCQPSAWATESGA